MKGETESTEIRPALVTDAAAISGLSGQLGYPTSQRQAEQRLGAILGSKDQAVLVALVDRQVVGWLHICLCPVITSDPFAEICGLVVSHSHRRCGLGRRLLAAAEMWATRSGVSTLRVRSRSDRDDARAFYGNLGFTIRKEQRVFDKSLLKDFFPPHRLRQRSSPL
jgi:GNAT superfamily N-acetyltransferase